MMIAVCCNSVHKVGISAACNIKQCISIDKRTLLNDGIVSLVMTYLVMSSITTNDLMIRNKN